MKMVQCQCYSMLILVHTRFLQKGSMRHCYLEGLNGVSFWLFLFFKIGISILIKSIGYFRLIK